MVGGAGLVVGGDFGRVRVLEGGGLDHGGGRREVAALGGVVVVAVTAEVVLFVEDEGG